MFKKILSLVCCLAIFISAATFAGCSNSNTEATEPTMPKPVPVKKATPDQATPDEAQRSDHDIYISFSDLDVYVLNIPVDLKTGTTPEAISTATNLMIAPDKADTMVKLWSEITLQKDNSDVILLGVKNNNQTDKDIKKCNVVSIAEPKNAVDHVLNINGLKYGAQRLTPKAILTDFFELKTNLDNYTEQKTVQDDAGSYTLTTYGVKDSPYSGFIEIREYTEANKWAMKINFIDSDKFLMISCDNSGKEPIGIDSIYIDSEEK